MLFLGDLLYGGMLINTEEIQVGWTFIGQGDPFQNYSPQITS